MTQMKELGVLGGYLLECVISQSVRPSGSYEKHGCEVFSGMIPPCFAPVSCLAWWKAVYDEVNTKVWVIVPCKLPRGLSRLLM
jgi:hypothetical protein